MAEVAQAHGRAELVHLGVAADEGDLLGPVDAEVFEVADALAQGVAPIAERAALDGVEDLGGVEGEHRGVPEAGGADAVLRHAEGVGRVVDDLQAVRLRDAFDGIDIAEVAVDVDGQDGDGAVGDQRLDLRGVEGVGHGVDVAEDRRAAAADDGVGRGGEGEGRGDDLPAQLQRLQDGLKRKMAVGEQTHMGHAEIILQRALESLVLLAHVGQPMAVPDAADLRAVLVKLRERGAGDVDGFRHRFKPSFACRLQRFLAIFTHSAMLRTISGMKISEEYSLKAKGLRMMPEMKRLNTKSTKSP